MTTAQTTLHPYPHRPVLVRAGEAERLDSAAELFYILSGQLDVLVESSAWHGARAS